MARVEVFIRAAIDSLAKMARPENRGESERWVRVNDLATKRSPKVIDAWRTDAPSSGLAIDTHAELLRRIGDRLEAPNARVPGRR